MLNKKQLAEIKRDTFVRVEPEKTPTLESNIDGFPLGRDFWVEMVNLANKRGKYIWGLQVAENGMIIGIKKIGSIETSAFMLTGYRVRAELWG
jgi:hypothetical protein